MAIDLTIDMAKALHREGRTAEAERAYRELLGRQPSALDALEGLGVLLFQGGNAQEASILFARAVAIDPSSARSHANLGEALRTIGRHDQALDHLRKAAALDPTNVQAWNSLGLVAVDAGRYAAAERAFCEAVRLEPRFAHAHTSLAGVLRLQGRLDEAMDHEQLASQRDPDGHPRPGFETDDSAFRVEVNARPAVPSPLSPAQPQATKGLAHLAEGQLDQAEDLPARGDPARLDDGRRVGRARRNSGRTRRLRACLASRLAPRWRSVGDAGRSLLANWRPTFWASYPRPKSRR